MCCGVNTITALKIIGVGNRVVTVIISSHIVCIFPVNNLAVIFTTPLRTISRHEGLFPVRGILLPTGPAGQNEMGQPINEPRWRPLS